ncbi:MULTISPECIES: hypothetical protein [Thermus]|uniref:Uncharacterized protein n=1 Tax=Thermus scotoductus TaxID=37636 RepID=A0A430RCX5_THESC|nr:MULTISPECIES: hypothetical protein [Thermus]BDG23786.1 hypothetical protein TthSNM33_09800 [Thermus thermophilus]QWK21887.1 MAG: hypothetical protein KNN15_12950 [Thermus antranikianii]RTG96303.1 hypothetical protein CSW49_05225 [Thermus scotoductus]RTH05218.1 hypothetical protein CSW45_03790 [Thermus scotoductus]RTH23516.1 hypothetical protein CSW42_00975 [Thermus scotoductus]
MGFAPFPAAGGTDPAPRRFALRAPLLAFLHAHRTPFLDRLALLLSQSASFKTLLPLLALLVLLTPLGLTRAYLGRRAWVPLVLAGGAFWVEVAK